MGEQVTGTEAKLNQGKTGLSRYCRTCARERIRVISGGWREMFFFKIVFRTNWISQRTRTLNPKSGSQNKPGGKVVPE